MSDHESDDERLAAFLDGRMDARRREEMLAHLTTSEEDRAVLAGTADILRQLEEAGAAAPEEEPALAAGGKPADTAVPEGVIPLDARRASRDREAGRRRAPALRWLALAAVLACVALAVGVLRSRSSVGGDPVRLAMRLEQGAEGLPTGWERPGRSDRGDDPGGTLSPGERSARAAQAGAMLVDLSVAVEARDSVETRLLARQIASRFDPPGGRNGALREITDGAGARPEGLRPLVIDATERIAKRLDGDALRLGAWVEAARLAANRQDAAFFRDGETREMLDRAERLRAADPPAYAAAQRVRPLLSADPPPWTALVPALDLLAGELGNE